MGNSTPSIQDLSEWYQSRLSYYKILAESASRCLRIIIEEEGIQCHRIENRVKTQKSFIEKIDNENFSGDPTKIHDLAGVRVITYIKSDLERVAKIVRKAFSVIEERNKTDDLKENEFGYRSLHFIAQFSRSRTKLPDYKMYKDVNFEIQVRTILEHAWAEIEHDRRYKYKGVLSTRDQRLINKVSGLLELADEEFDRFVKKVDKYSKGTKTSREKKLYIPRGTNKNKLKQIGNILRRNKGKDKLTLVIPRGNDYEYLRLPYLVNYSKAIEATIKETIDDKGGTPF